MNGLAQKSYAQIIAENRRLRIAAAGKEYRVTILSNVLVNSLAPVLECLFLSDGLPVTLTHARFDNIVQESAALEKTDAVIVFMDMMGIAMSAQHRLGEDTVDCLAQGLSQNVSQVLKNLSASPLVIFNGFSALPLEAHQLRVGPFGQIAARLNEILNKQAPKNLVSVDMDKVYALTGLDKAIDYRQVYTARSIHTLEFFKQWALLTYPAFRSAAGRARKVLVADCDNTLWGGIIGEDGIDGIHLDDTTVDGPFFREAQQILKSWKQQGVLLAIASKNNPDDVRQAFASRNMVLAQDDFVLQEIGWDEKLVSLQNIAAKLNLGCDSLVFLDDSPFELARVRTALPEVTCLQVPERISDYPAFLREASGLFLTLARTEEDARRTQMYHEEIVRQESKAQFQSLEGYLESLQVEVTFSEGGEINLQRAAQMSQKTNQFNLTTRRYTAADIERMVHDPATIVATFSVHDRFGDYGTTGLVIVRLQPGGVAALDTFLMSCRVLGRKVEETVMDWICARLRAASCKALKGVYIPTDKNGQVADLLDRLGFARLSTDQRLYTFALDS